jgi:hypothetical protein
MIQIMKLKISILLLAICFAFTACDNFEKINTDPAKSSETQPEFLLSSAEKRASDILYGNYYNGRIGMQLSQYWMGTDKTSDGRFLFTDEGMWSGLYSGPLMDLQEIQNYYKRYPSQTNPNMIAVSEILKSWIFHILTDVYGDIPYSQALKGDEIPKPVFDQGKDVYAGILTNLKTQISTLQSASSNPVRGDIIANGDINQWIRIANALRIRIALRMIDAQPDASKTILLEAAQNTLTSGSQNAFFPYDLTASTNRFPYNDVERALVEFAVSGTLVDYMKSVDDPRLAIYARPNETDGVYLGKVYGTEANAPTMPGLSKPGVQAYAGNAKGYMITYAEIAFALAEASARGINVGGSAEEWYTKGINASMTQWGITNQEEVASYLNKVPYVAEDWKNVIGTQKWLALYMQGIQGWMERLRLDNKQPGGADLFIAPASGSLDPQVTFLPNRLKYPAITRSSNADNSKVAADRIGGDTQATKNWWDVQ